MEEPYDGVPGASSRQSSVDYPENGGITRKPSMESAMTIRNSAIISDLPLAAELSLNKSTQESSLVVIEDEKENEDRKEKDNNNANVESPRFYYTWRKTVNSMMTKKTKRQSENENENRNQNGIESENQRTVDLSAAEVEDIMYTYSHSASRK